MLLATSASAALVDFTTLNRLPQGTLVIDGVTVSGDDGALVATEFGRGLGLAGVGSSASIDRSLSWTSGSSVGDVSAQSRDGELTLSVDGMINSLTILPYMLIEGPEAATFPQFEMSYRPLVTGEISTRTQTTLQPFAPLIFTFRPDRSPSVIADVGLFSDFGQYPFFLDYRTAFGNPESTIMFGFSIISLDYTPAFQSSPLATPEPTTLLLLGPCVFLARRWRRHV
jgi:hypothetical protein